MQGSIVFGLLCEVSKRSSSVGLTDASSITLCWLLTSAGLITTVLGPEVVRIFFQN